MPDTISTAIEVTESERKTRIDLAAAFRLVDLYGWSDMLATHLSARIPGPNEHFLINPVGTLFEEMTASCLVKVDIDGNILSESEFGINPAGYTIHSAVHMGRKDAGCVMHTHTAAGLGVATQKSGLLPLTQMALAVIAQTSYHSYEGPAFDLGERDRLIEDLSSNNVLILRNHGLLTVGKTVAEAFVWMFRAERACRFQLSFQQAGAPAQEISKAVQDISIERSKKAISASGHRPIGQFEWPALLRKLNRENPGYDE
ncbi:class II aldolase/adducin family protein [Rhodospirillaceae bacterium]|nr:class II aldolase/adducin family protein [Rhodospirillaceae bacterium]MBT7730978.1 class II aldolase/adducin family protein [Rhodospirillaceae bacterium]MDC1442895.1 class II aldolase/adducin family protein [Rhodospirillaceae bacterium]MDG1275097.1 class II aldolase/adducin family protein [Alphaproteobacteria bacterium]|tara:strand:- start:145 stop:918 length:774 start_codon:yes stop_codon:yes gene_type:complete